MIDASIPDRLMPAEWEPHEATWIGWPHHEPDWPGKLEPIPWVYAEIVRVLSAHERVEILCANEAVLAEARDRLERTRVDPAGYRLHLVPTDRVWLRDSGPTCVRTPDGRIELVHWKFNAWAKYDNFAADENVPVFVEKITGLKRHEACLPDSGKRIVLEGGGIETDGAGTLLVTEECFLSDVQARNPEMSRADYERAFSHWLGTRKTIWLGCGCVGDDTHGHIDDIARFVAPGVVLLAYEADPTDENHEASVDNLRRLELARDAAGRPLRVIKLPMPRPVWYEDMRLPASYANFYIANGVVIVPTFNDVNDRVALNILAEAFPDRQVVGIHAVDLVLGQGTLHCLTQQQPAARPADA
ncbi:MAG TPA: agmatine deiminase family protein [Phycisphaerae bacterium]|jgi:agmatine deiminase|nr:agmatine deiminase family protein [Phycisphaerae bacterium]HOJ53068.1 agmatine deiminase family protein [Phycisphaerae bacterium]HOL24805.1 agmatine deiminase family protein [Phycisphaerae bacterium]HPP19341.1 agmatine deiminase family protein [Phycisphaerae bacterium]HPU31272.1 agmatine deiminase family protein [Phycisphaerae bacterium]